MKLPLRLENMENGIPVTQQTSTFCAIKIGSGASPPVTGRVPQPPKHGKEHRACPSLSLTRMLKMGIKSSAK